MDLGDDLQNIYTLKSTPKLNLHIFGIYILIGDFNVMIVSYHWVT